MRQVSKEEMIEFGKYLKEKRLSIGFNKTEMGRELGVHQATIRRWEDEGVVPHRDLYEIKLDIEYIVKQQKLLTAVS